MNKKMKQILISAALLALPGTAVYAASDPAAAQPGRAPAAVNAAAGDSSDSAYAADLKAAEDLLKGLSHERKLTPAQSGEFMAREMDRARKYFQFAKATLAPHGLAMAKLRRDPAAMMEEGRKLVAADPSSWQGYDYLGSGSLMKGDIPGAMENYKKALAAAPEMQKDWYNYMLAACYKGSSDPAKAMELYEGIIAKNENWMAVKVSYLGASMMLLSKDPAKAVAYFDKGFLLHTPEEQAVLRKTSLCGKFRDLEKGPEACVKTN